ncbi:proline dehydrogenase 1, mitochondrial [Nilaparvata lugens]|nr:proline dehydrogenase 1, mitochondrial [Nilaparvata lugens]XP_022190182.2 proline dehydrogenase 1, mitochondrial [Nilaparvata lugens]XP_039295276.1 proline dehydrogenase 1, mitochondrial [Nilaparvata lugens]
MLRKLASLGCQNTLQVYKLNHRFTNYTPKLVVNQLIKSNTFYSRVQPKEAEHKNKETLSVPITTYCPEKDKALDLTFINAEEAFKSKKTSDLLRALVVYNLCSINFLVENNAKLMKLFRGLLGERLFVYFMKKTFYGHFVAGEDQHNILPLVTRMKNYGVGSILDYSVEEDISEAEAVKREYEGTVSEAERGLSVKDSEDQEVNQETKLKTYKAPQQFSDRRKDVSSVRTYFYLNEAACDRSLEVFQECIQAVGDAQNYGTGVAAIKLTALGRPQMLLQISEVIMRARKFVSDVVHSGNTFTNVLQHHLTEEELENRLQKAGIKDAGRFLQQVVKDKQGVIHLFPWNGIVDENLNLSDTFRVPSLKDGRMVRLISQLSPNEEQMFRNMIHRLNVLLQTAKEYKVPVMVDAEQTYFQPAISRITMEMMHKHNVNEAVVLNTYQCYLKDTYNEVLNDLEQATREDFYFGAKIVRGAYLEQERFRAEKLGLEDPTNPSFEATTDMYCKVLMEFLDRIQKNNQQGKSADGQGKVMVMVASHNEETVRFAIEEMRRAGICPSHKSVLFGQLLGMCDYITFPLGQAGYAAYKYVPYGPVTEVLPYLSRRVVENKGVLKKVKKEKELLWQEIKRRSLNNQLFYKPPL